MEKRAKEFTKVEGETQEIYVPTNRELELDLILCELAAENEDLHDINEKLIKVIARLRKERKELEREIEWLRDELNEYNRKYGDGNTFY